MTESLNPDPVSLNMDPVSVNTGMDPVSVNMDPKNRYGKKVKGLCDS